MNIPATDRMLYNEGRIEMKFKAPVCLAVLAIAILSVTAFADQIVLKNGAVYSGKFIRGDERTVEFRVLGRVESFRVANVSQIIFMEPELQTPPNPRSSKVLVAPEAPEIPADMSEPTSSISATQPENPPPVVQPPPPPVNTVQAQPESYSGMIFPKGTPVVIRTISAIDTDRNRVGDVFEATLEDAMVWGNQTVFPRGTTLKGRIAYAKESGKLSGQSQLVLELTDIVAKGRTYFLRTSDYTEVGSSRGNRTAATVGGTAALGAIIGAIAGGGKGAAIGAASGAAVGTGVQVVTRGEVLRIPAETVIEFKLQSALRVDP
jgi:hypothetical protein